jgi:hypothetical protein
VDTLQVDNELFVGAISNTNATHVAWLDAHVPELNNFELVVMSNEVALLKPDPEIFELALELLDVPASQYSTSTTPQKTLPRRSLQAWKVSCIPTGKTTRPRIEAWCSGWRIAPTASIKASRLHPQFTIAAIMTN